MVCLHGKSSATTGTNDDVWFSVKLYLQATSIHRLHLLLSHSLTVKQHNTKNTLLKKRCVFVEECSSMPSEGSRPGMSQQSGYHISRFLQRVITSLFSTLILQSSFGCLQGCLWIWTKRTYWWPIVVTICFMSAISWHFYRTFLFLHPV